MKRRLLNQMVSDLFTMLSGRSFHHIVCNLYGNVFFLMGVILVILEAHLVQINEGNLLYTAIFFFLSILYITILFVCLCV